MSYILDALNKSEKERSKRKAPGIRALSEEETSNGFAAKHWFFLLLILIIVNSLGAYLLVGDRFSSSNEPNQRTEQPTPSINKATSLVEVPTPSIAAIPIPLSPPELSITTHIYADDPSLRLVKINGIDRREGDLIGPEHRLIQITETGVLLSYGREEYVLNVVEDWQNDL